jgi:hypothetical protein
MDEAALKLASWMFGHPVMVGILLALGMAVAFVAGFRSEYRRDRDG